ncbi:MAG: B12-binding domain-containing radical SAM protein, partial [Candidatus Omnitrophica bacterium]|nr:B12-binding domain-containing radical SAM protein [Candidatus Omnitrophota bacterium]
MSDITLINISIAKYFGTKVVYERNAVGIFLLIAVLERSGFKVAFHEHFLDHRCTFKEETDRFMSLIDPTSLFIGIGCHSVHLPFAVRAAKKLKTRFPDKIIIMGGMGPSAVAKQLLERFAFIDVIVVGEAEETIVEVIEKGRKAFKDIRGIVYREKDAVFVNDPRPPIEDLDGIPLPAYHAVDFKREYQIPTLFTSRGCSFACSFCSLSTFWGKKIRYRSIDNVMQELIFLKEHFGTKYIFFGDPTFNADRDRILMFCRRMKKEGLGLKWECLVRADYMDEEMMDCMKQAGCETVFYGLESGSRSVYKKVKHDIFIDKSIENIQKSFKYFKTVEVSLIWGFPFETLDDFKTTLEMRNSLENEPGCEVQLRWLEPYPGTQLYKEY